MQPDRAPDVPILNGDEEEILRAQIANDPDAAELDDAQLAQLRPAQEALAGPLYAALAASDAVRDPWIPVTIHVRREVIEAFGADWQERMSAVLIREAERLTQGE